MDLTSLFNSLTLIKPEIIISITLVVLVIFDLIFDKRKTIVPIIALVGLFIAGIYVLIDLQQTGFAFSLSNANSKSGMVTIDSFGSYFKIIIILSSILIVFFSYASS